MLLGNFKRGKDRKKRKSRKIITGAAIGAGLGTIAGGSLSYAKNNTNKLLEEAYETTGALDKYGAKGDWLRETMKSAFIKDAQRIRKTDPKAWKEIVGPANKLRLRRTTKGALLGLGLGAGIGLGVSAYRNREKENKYY